MVALIKGRGAQIILENKYNQLYCHLDNGYDPAEQNLNIPTEIYTESPKSIISKNDSPDIPFNYSINPYQGCEHGCVYCYARNSHEYWGFNASLDFESKIISKPNAPDLLRKRFNSKSWKPEKIILSGNTDCYQPIEKKLKITRNLLKVFLEFGNPVGIITKNILVLRDTDLLKKLAEENLVHIIFSISSLDENIRQKLEPRSATGFKRLKAIRKLKDNGIPVSVMLSPVIPGLNDHEIPTLIRESSNFGANDIHMTLIRLNGIIGIIFKDWLKKHYPEKEKKILNQIKSLHNGKLSESRFGYRMRGEGPLSQSIHQLFKTIKSHYFRNHFNNELDTSRFRRHSIQSLF
jgi:DNA repair photolyase